MIVCERCAGRGWTGAMTPGGWPEVCAGCCGVGRFSFAGLARGLAPKDREARRRLRYAIERIYVGAPVHGATARTLLDAMARRGLLGKERS